MDIGDEEQQDTVNTQQPYFDNSAEYLFRIVEPDGKNFFPDVNKDITTSYFKAGNGIEIYLQRATLIGYSSILRLPKLTEIYTRENSNLVNIQKSEDGFMMKTLTKQEQQKSISYSMDKGYSKAMKGG